MKPIRFFVPGVAKPGGSKTAGAIYRKGPDGRPVPVVNEHGRVLTTTREACKGNPAWRATVATAARAAYEGAPIDEPLFLGVLFLISRPKSHLSARGGLKPSAPPYPTGKPDATKLMRAVEDALKGILYVDDSRCVAAWASKVYTLGQAGAWVTLLPASTPRDEFARLMHYTA